MNNLSSVKIFFIILFCSTLSLFPSQVIILMGPSCAGKSTLAKYLCKQLNTQNSFWTIVDFDNVEENIELLISTTNEYLSQNNNVIIDTNTYDNTMETKLHGAAHITKIIISAPLNILLQRNEIRNQKLNRNAKRAYWCRHFVIESFKRFLAWPAHLYIDTSIYSIHECCMIILGFLQKLSFNSK